MTDQEMADYLRNNGYPEHVVRSGRAGLIARWRKFVEEVEHGYKLGENMFAIAVHGGAGTLSRAILTSALKPGLPIATIASGKAPPKIPFGTSGIPKMPAHVFWKILKKMDLTTKHPHLNRHRVDSVINCSQCPC